MASFRYLLFMLYVASVSGLRENMRKFSSLYNKLFASHASRQMHKYCCDTYDWLFSSSRILSRISIRKNSFSVNGVWMEKIEGCSGFDVKFNMNKSNVEAALA